VSDVTKIFAKNADGSFGTCVKCKTRSAENETGFCRACAYLNKYDASATTARQVANGIKMLQSSTEMIRWPWRALHLLTGPIMMGHVVYIVAASGVGKTTLSLDMVRRWATDDDIGVTVLPLETTPHEWRMAMASIECGISHGEIFELVSQLSEGDASVAETVQRVADTMERQWGDPKMLKNVHVMDNQQVTVEGLDFAFALAKQQGHKVVLIDHIDHVGTDPDSETGKSSSGLDSVRSVNNAVLALAKYHNLAVVAMSQANSSIKGDGTNVLARFRKLELHHVMYNSFKVPNASQIIGVYRPVKAGASMDDVAAVRNGTAEPMSVLATDRIGLNMMKLRHRGRNEQETLELAYVGGQIREMDRHETEQAAVLRSLTGPVSHMSEALRKRRP
jgi:hypothetical protein